MRLGFNFIEPKGESFSGPHSSIKSFLPLKATAKFGGRGWGEMMVILMLSENAMPGQTRYLLLSSVPEAARQRWKFGRSMVKNKNIRI